MKDLFPADIETYQKSKCNRCKEQDPQKRYFYSNLCLHRICENCFNQVFIQNISAQYFKCMECSRDHEKTNYNIKNRDEIIYNEDFKIRDKVMQMFYKPIDDFSSEDEYDNYLAFIEEKITNSKDLERIIKELTDTIGKLNIDLYKVKRSQIIDELDELRKENNPNNKYNSKISKDEKYIEYSNEDKINIMGNQNIQREKNIQPIKRYPQYQEGSQIKIVRDENLEKKAGGYNVDILYKNLLQYALFGLKKQ